MALIIFPTVKYPFYTGSLEELPPKTYALVLGAGVLPDGTPSAALYDRVKQGVNLYKLGKVSKLLMTGDGRFHHYNETEVMRSLAMEMGVLSDDIIIDPLGRRTYDSFYRAQKIFHIKDTYVVSQAFHLPRCLMLSRYFDVSAVGIPADLHNYPLLSRVGWQIREFLAIIKAWIDMHIFVKTPVE